MTTTPETTKISSPLQLIFWGNILCAIQNNFGEFSFVPACIGLAMISRGVFSLSRIPVSKTYRTFMRFAAFVSMGLTIATLAAGVLSPFTPILKFPPNGFVFAAFLFVCFLCVLSIVFFCRCMAEYCAAEQWENTYHSWRYSTRLFLFGVLLPFAVLAVPLHILFTSLEFEPKNADISSRSTSHGDGTILYEIIKKRAGCLHGNGISFFDPQIQFLGL